MWGHINKEKKAYKMKISKKAIVNKINTCLLEGKFEEVQTLEKALSIFGMGAWYGDTGMAVKIIEVI